MALYIQKYGGTSVGTIERIKTVAAHIAQVYQAGNQLIIVVSAMGDQTDELLELALQLSLRPPQRELDMLLTAGERISMSLLSIALDSLGIPTVSYTGSQSGIITDNRFGNAQIKKITGDRIKSSLNDRKVVIVAGFQGVSELEKEITTLGRGGSDLTAIALAYFCKADSCQIFKDVDGVCTADPRLVDNARVISRLSWDSLSTLTWYGSGVVHNRGVHLAKKFKIPLEIRSSFNLDRPGTRIGSSKPVENACVYAITHKNSLASLIISKFPKHLVSQVFEFLGTKGEYPIFLQFDERHEEGVLELILSSKFVEDFVENFRNRIPELKIEMKKLNLSSITVVGDGFWQDPKILSELAVIIKAPIHKMECKNTSINLFIDSKNADEFVPLLHSHIFPA